MMVISEVRVRMAVASYLIEWYRVQYYYCTVSGTEWSCTRYSTTCTVVDADRWEEEEEG
jgi:hypothetical protein